MFGWCYVLYYASTVTSMSVDKQQKDWQGISLTLPYLQNLYLFPLCCHHQEFTCSVWSKKLELGNYLKGRWSWRTTPKEAEIGKLLQRKLELRTTPREGGVENYPKGSWNWGTTPKEAGIGNYSKGSWSWGTTLRAVS